MREGSSVAGQFEEFDVVEFAHGISKAFTADYGDLAIAVGMVLAGWYVSKLVVRLTGRTIAQRIERPSVTRTALRGVRVLVLGFTFALAAGVLFDDLQFLVPVTVFTAVVGVILAPIVGSFINGLFVLADRPYEIGDMIEIADVGHRGFVEDITIRYTKIFTLENTFIVIPNSEIRSRDVINYSAEDERTRVPIQFEVTYGSDVERARRVAERAARGVDVVIAGGPDIRIGSARYSAAPTCNIDRFADSGVLLTLQFWVEHPYRLLVARSAVQERLWERFQKEERIEFAYPHRHLVFESNEGGERQRLDPPGRGDEGSA